MNKLTKFRHPWTNGLVERMNRTIKEDTVKVYFYSHFSELKKHLLLWLQAYNFQKKLKSLNFLTPYEKIKKLYEIDGDNFNENPNHKNQGLNT
jgi:transposase InsO family protein